MKFNNKDIFKIAKLSRVAISEEDCEKYSNELGNIFDLINQMQAIDTSDVEPMYNPHDMTLNLREDVVTEKNKRDEYQEVAPKTESGLYLVPKVIE